MDSNHSDVKPSDIKPSDVKKKRKPSKQTGRRPVDTTDKAVPKGRQEKARQHYTETVAPQQRLRDRIKQMQKDRAKGSYACEENANHEY